MKKHEMLFEWLKDIMPYGKDVTSYVQIVEEKNNLNQNEYTIRLNFFTDRYKYHIVAIDRKDKIGYLGCGMSCRKQRSGEEWTRGSDLPDGPFVHATWPKIKNAIIGNELRPLGQNE